MKRGVLIALGLALGAVLGSLLLDDPGIIELRLHGYLIGMSVPVALVLLLGLYALWRMIKRAWRLRRVQTAERLLQQRERSQAHLARGLLELSAGDWSRAEQTLTRSAFGALQPAVHFLAAARAAELQGALTRRDEWLTKALDAAPEARAAIHITQAEMLLRHNQLDTALTTLEQLDASGHQNARGLQLLARIHRQQGNWQQLKDLEPRLRREAGIDAQQLNQVLVQIYLDMLASAANIRSIERLREVWQEIPKTMRQRADVLVSYARAAQPCGAANLAEAELRDFLHDTWNESVVLAYGELEVSEPLVMLQTIEKWLHVHPQDAALLLTGARCCIRNELYGKARAYLEASIAIKPKLDSSQLLAQLLEQMGERELAFNTLSTALSQAVGRKPTQLKLRAQRLVEGRKGSDRRGTQ